MLAWDCIQYGTDKQAHENVLKQIKQKELPDFIDSAETITLQALGSHQTSVLEEDEAFFNNAKQDSKTTTFQAAVRCCVTATLAA